MIAASLQGCIRDVLCFDGQQWRCRARARCCIYFRKKYYTTRYRFTCRLTSNDDNNPTAAAIAQYALVVSREHDGAFNGRVIAYAVSVKAGYRTRLAATNYQVKNMGWKSIEMVPAISVL